VVLQQFVLVPRQGGCGLHFFLVPIQGVVGFLLVTLSKKKFACLWRAWSFY